MFDQAAELRQRMTALTERPASAVTPPRVVVAWGAVQGVGASSTAVNLAVELGRHGRRALLVDAAPDGEATRLCRLQEPGALHRAGFGGASIADVYRGRRSLAAAICRSSHGLRVVGSPGGAMQAVQPTNEELTTLCEEIAKLSSESDLIVVDVGSGDSPTAMQLTERADRLLLVTSVSDRSVMETYASIKRLTAAGVATEVVVVASRAASAAGAEDAFTRLRHGCRQFLGREIAWAGCILEDATVADAALCAAPYVALSPRCDAARGIQQTADALLAALSNRTQAAIDDRDQPRERGDERHDMTRLLASLGEAA